MSETRIVPKSGFYNIKTLSQKNLKLFYKDSVMLAYDVHIDILSNTSWRRESTTDKTIKEMIDNCSTEYHNVCIDRSIQHPGRENYGEIGYVKISADPEYFLYIFVTLKNLKILTDKYNLEMN